MIEFIQILSHEYSANHLAIILLTSLSKTFSQLIALTAMEGDSERCLSVGMNAYLSKPVKLVDLESVIKQWLSKSTVHQKLRSPNLGIEG